MKTVTGADVAEVVFNFAQRCFIGESGGEPVDLEVEESFFDALSSGPLGLNEAHQFPLKHRRLLRELLSQYSMFLLMNRSLQFDASFVAGSSKERLGGPLVAYMCEHGWPFPQLLPMRQMATNQGKSRA